MSRKKLSIHDVLKEDRTQLNESLEGRGTPVSASISSEPTLPKEPKARRPRGRPPKKGSISAPQSSPSSISAAAEKESKADYVRLSITLPPELFERLQMVSIQRRRRKEAYTFCHLVREAIHEWIDEAEEN